MTRGGLIYALAQMSERERILLLLLSVIVIPLAVVFLALQPMMQARDDARIAALEARALLTWVSGQVEALPAENGQAERDVVRSIDPIGISGIEESLVTLGLRSNVSQLANRAAGGVDLTLDEASFELVTAWLDTIAPIWGYRLAAFRVEALSPGLVNAAFELVPAQ
jgi:type II secretory pathway component PulM